jgi:hypothetical protein
MTNHWQWYKLKEVAMRVRDSIRIMGVVSVIMAVTIGVASALLPAHSARANLRAATSTPQVRHFTLYDGSQVTLNPDGIGSITDRHGRNARYFATVLPQGQSALGGQVGPSDAALIRQLSVPAHSGATSDVVIALTSATFNGQPIGHGTGPRRITAHTTDSVVNAALHAVGATTAYPLFHGVSSQRLAALSRAAQMRFGRGAVNLQGIYVVHVTGMNSTRAAQRLAKTQGVSYAAPDEYVAAMSTSPVSLPSWVTSAAARISKAPLTATSSPGLPTNFGLVSSMQSYLNANGVNLMGGYADIEHQINQLPGTGEIITNVSLGDLTDQSMADAGDGYVSYFGPTTIVNNGQRYLDYPSLPLIPTYTVSQAGAVDPLGTVERVDPYLGEVLLDFSMMAPLPDGLQRPDAQGSGVTDLLGIAPGASYRLVEPEQPTFANIAAAMLVAAQQTPPPSVITASLGFGTDVAGFPGRYLEDDPMMRSVVAAIVQQYGITVTISSNDGTRLYTPAPVGPDGGSTATNLPGRGQTPTSVGDDANSTTPSLVPDSGAITVGGTTLDDTIAVPPQTGGVLAHNGTFAETRLDGATSFSSGFGTRVNVSAPSDNIAALMHYCSSPGSCQPTDAVTVLSGGTSASAPMTAAVVADLLQVAKFTGNPLTPAAVRAVLERTARAVPTQPQVDQPLHVGPQIDMTAAVEYLLKAYSSPTIVRLSTAHRSELSGSGASFVEMTNPDAISLQGEDLFGPITFGLDVSGVPAAVPATYTLVVNGHVFASPTPSIRLTPTELLAAAGLPVISTDNRSIQVTAQVKVAKGVIASASESLTFGPTDGTHPVAAAPLVPSVVASGADVHVQYDLTGVTGLRNPQLIVSSINHWSPFSAPLYRVGYSVPLSATTGTVTVPASVFAAGGGVYGFAIKQNAFSVGTASSMRVDGGLVSARPSAPLLTTPGASPGHTATIVRSATTFQVAWDASNVAGATGASLEISAPGPTIYNLLNTFTNQNGTLRDNNGGDTGSVAMIPLSGVSGTTTLDATTLGIASSLHYTVRILATKGDQIIGQASPVSSLEYDDGLAPGGATVTGFAIHPGGASSVSTAIVGTDGNPVGSDLYNYSPASGQYGATYADDSTGQNVYVTLGSDTGNGHLLAEKSSWYGTGQDVLTYDTADGHLVGDVPIDSSTGYWLAGGRVDTTRHRMVLLGWRGSDHADTLLPFDTNTGQAGTPVVVGNGSITRSFYRYMDVDQSTGQVDLAGSLVGDLCVIRRSGYTTVNLDAGTSTPMTVPNRCLTGVASDQAGHAELTVGPLYSFPMFPQGRLQQANEADGSVGGLTLLGADSPLFPTVDTVHGLLVVGFLAGTNYRTDNNGMSGVGVYDLHTGQRVSYTGGFNLFPAVYGFTGEGGTGSLLTAQGIQLDPATRTGWTFGPDGNQVQQFSY